MNFYEVANDYMEKLEVIQSGINPETGEMTEDENQLAVWKEEIAKDIQAKSQNIIAVFRNEKRTIQAIEEEIKRLSEMKDKRKKKLSNFEDWVKTCMLSYNIEKIETPIGKLSFSNSEAVEIFEGIEVLLNGKKIYPVKANEIEALTGCVKDEDGYMCVEKSIGFYAPDEKVESILVGEQGYYE